MPMVCFPNVDSEFLHVFIATSLFKSFQVNVVFSVSCVFIWLNGQGQHLTERRLFLGQHCLPSKIQLPPKFGCVAE